MPTVRRRTRAIAYSDVIPTLSRLTFVSQTSPRFSTHSHPSPSSLTYHPSPSAFSLRFDFKLAERFARVVLRCLSPTSLGFSRSSLLLTRSLLSLLLSCLLLPLVQHSGTSIVSQHYHLHLCTRSIGTSSLPPEGSPRQEYHVLSLIRSPRTACLSV
jgi:hypothetical protein